MWEELLKTIGKYNGKLNGYLEALQMAITGYDSDETAVDLNLVDQWFNERGYDYVGDVDLFDENNQSDIYVEVDGIVWRSHSNAHDNSIYWYYDPGMFGDGISLDDLRFLHGNVHQFIWEQDEKLAYIVNMM